MIRASFVLLVVFAIAAHASVPNGTCSDEHVNNVRRLLLAGFASLDVKEQLPLRDVNDPAFSLSAGNLFGLRFLNISGDVKTTCGANESIAEFVAVVPQVKGHYNWRSRGESPLSGDLVVEGRNGAFTGRLRHVRGFLRSASLAFSHFSAVSIQLDGVSSFSVPGSKIISLGNNAFNKAVRKTTTNVVSPALKKAVQASE
uniref:Putative secreted protein n=1 Tax=Ixodes ricinus TaxID=34613 RepID=A0A131Y8A7_IXORI